MCRLFSPALVPLFVTLLIATPLAAKDWALNPELSSLSFASIKKANIGEVHHFTGLAGTVSDSGQAAIAIDLASVETWIDIRNERMRDVLFETAKFPRATLSATIPTPALKAAKPGTLETVSATITLALHGVELPLKADLMVARLSPTRVLVVPSELIMLDATAFGFGPGLQKLAELAELPAISSAVPVSFHFVFDERN